MVAENTISEMASKGGQARAQSLSKAQRSEIARKAVEARWQKAGKQPLPRIAHVGMLKLGSLEIECAVLDNGERVLSHRGFSAALGVVRSGAIYKGSGGDNLPHFLANKRLKPFIDSDLAAEISAPLKYIPKQGGRDAYGVKAELIPRVCDVWLKARAAGALNDSALSVATKAEMLVRGLAHVGIIALVDEATGYQDLRARDALAKILEAFVAKELQKWVRTFEPEYYEQIFRLKNWRYAEMNGRRPRVLGTLTNDLVYKRIAPGVLDELKRVNPADEHGRRKHKHFQRLTPDFGHPKLKQHLAVVTGYMRIADDWDGFMRILDRGLPRQTALPLFDEKKPDTSADPPSGSVSG